MISFELANGNPYGPHVPTSIDDDQYVEYAFDDVTYFPTTAEDEEQVLPQRLGFYPCVEHIRFNVSKLTLPL